MKKNKRIKSLGIPTDRHVELFLQSKRNFFSIAGLQSNDIMRKNWGKSWYPYIQQQVRWCLPDSEALYKKNIKKNFKLMKALRFIDSHMNDDFNYSFNEYGFRSDSFDNKCTILFNGCSQTVGIGLPLQDIWSKKIADHYNINYHNIANGGSDFGHIAQRSVYWLYKLRPKYHIIKETLLTRFNWWRDGYIQSTTNWENNKLGENILDIALDSDNTEWARYISLKVIKSVCDELYIKLLVLPPGRIMNIMNRSVPFPHQQGEDLARDLLHYGRNEQNQCCQYVIEKEFIKI